MMEPFKKTIFRGLKDLIMKPNLKFSNFKIEVINSNAGCKRRLDDSCLDDSYEPPDKNLSKRFSSDLGSVVVSSDPLPEGHSTTASEIVSPSGKNLCGDKGQALPRLSSEQVHGGKSEEWVCCEGGLVPSTLPGSDTGEQEGCLNDEGYFTRSYLHARRAGSDVSKAATPTQPQLSSSPLIPASSSRLRSGTEEEEGSCPPEPNKGQATCPEWPVPFNLGEEDTSLHGAPLIPLESADECLEGTTGEVWAIGNPVLQSSLCHCDTESPSVVCIEGSEVEDEREGGVLRPAQEFQDTLGSEETSYETTLPLQVQVRSVVVFPNPKDKPPSPPSQPRDLQKTATDLPKEVKKTSQRSKRTAVKTATRPLVYDSEERWQHEKRIYVDKVTSHMMEQDQGLGNGLMTEWRNLMNRVADQRPGTKHSSDLTCRNYQERYGNENPGFTLDQWQNHSFKNHKRFCKVPLLFERSPVP